MVASTHTSTPFLQSTGFAWLGRLRSGLAAWRAGTAERSRIIRELSQYADHELAELGIGRGDIIDVAEGRYRGGR